MSVKSERTIFGMFMFTHRDVIYCIQYYRVQAYRLFCNGAHVEDVFFVRIFFMVLLLIMRSD